MRAAESTIVRRSFTGIVVGLAFLAFSSSTAFAADYGNWDGNYCGDRGEGCFWNGAISASRMTSSNERDSNFNNNYFGGGTSLQLNDRVKYMDNRFTTLKLRAYHNADYITASTCIGGGVSIGPYVNDGSNAGLPSFKSC